MSGHGQSKRQRDDQSQQGKSVPASKKSNHKDDQPSSVSEMLKQVKELEEENSMLKEENSLLKEYSMLKREKKNRSFESLMMVSEGSFNLIRQGRAYSHVNGNHSPAKATFEKDFCLQDPKKEKLKSSHHASLLLQEFVDQEYVEGPNLKFKRRTYGSEAVICSFVRLALKDAITILENEGDLFQPEELETKLERSLFGCRPDILVVRDSNGVGLLAVEVKQPLEQGGKPLADYEKVLGHAFDHAMAMDAFGLGTALVMITTFEESNLCSLNESDLKGQDDGEETDQCKSKVAASPQSPSMQHDTPTTQSPPNSKEPESLPSILPKVPCGSSSSSPSNSSAAGSPSTAAGGSNQEVECIFTKGTNERLLYTSKSYKSHQLVKLAYTALKVAKKHYQASTREIYHLRLDQTYVFPRALRVVEEKDGGYFWGNLRVKLGQSIKSQDHFDSSRPRNAARKKIDDKDEASYYIIGALGHGVTSNVYRALDSRGKQVALKVYVKSVNDNNNVMERDTFNREAERATEREKDFLLDFYPFLEGEVKNVRLFGLWCVVLPFFEPVMKANRKEQLPKIEEVLRDTFKIKGMKYREEDIHWRHVGNYVNGEKSHCILYDLADLEKAGKVNDNFVDGHVDTFRRRLDQEPELQNQPLNACVVSPAEAM